MEIGPVRNDQPNSGRVETENIKKNSGPKAALAGDRVEISNETRMKLAALADRAFHEASKTHRQSGSKAIQKSLQQHDNKTAKLERVRERVKSGFYNRSDIRQKIAERLAAKFKKHSDKGK
jgi:hypothetical protein